MAPVWHGLGLAAILAAVMSTLDAQFLTLSSMLERDVLRRFVTEGPTEAELQAAKDFMVGGFALRIDSNRKLLDNLAAIAWNNLPLDYLDTWTQQVEKVSVDQIKAAFARKLQPERMVSVVVGATAPANTRQ